MTNKERAAGVVRDIAQHIPINPSATDPATDRTNRLMHCHRVIESALDGMMMDYLEVPDGERLMTRNQYDEIVHMEEHGKPMHEVIGGTKDE